MICWPWTLLAILVALSAPASAGEVTLNGHVFTLPDGFEIELIAGPPLVNRPITGAFDEQGRLYVADSSGSNDPVKKQLAERPHRILRLEDTDGDGRFDRHTVFADKMMFPEGTMWLDGSLYVSAAPTIWKLTDTNGDGVADRREEWLTRTLTGCANDLHGPYPGPDGWIYWCKGAFARQTYQLPGHERVASAAAHIFRAPARRHGARAGDDRRHGQPGRRRLHARGRADLYDDVPRASAGGAARRADSRHLRRRLRQGSPRHQRPPADRRPNAAAGASGPGGTLRPRPLRIDDVRPRLSRQPLRLLFQHAEDHAAQADRLPEPTFHAETTDFLVSNNLDFHPTDILEDADGSLIVIDTGGWYKLCCPTSQLWKPDILGAIYRIRRKGAAKIDDPRGLKLDWTAASLESMVQPLATRGPRSVTGGRLLNPRKTLGDPRACGSS